MRQQDEVVAHATRRRCACGHTCVRVCCGICLVMGGILLVFTLMFLVRGMWYVAGGMAERAGQRLGM